MRRTRLVAAAAVLVVLLGCSSDEDDGDDDGSARTTTTSAEETTTTATLPEVAASELVEVPCEDWWEVPDDAPADVTVTCGTVDVPSDAADPASDPITLAVARVHGRGDADAEPVLSLHGGPGGDALSGPPTGLMALDILDERDVITFDQRGAGRSLPSLNCPEKGGGDPRHARRRRAVGRRAPGQRRRRRGLLPAADRGRGDRPRPLRHTRLGARHRGPA